MATETYWDLSEKARAALTDERVALLERVELMSEGVLMSEPLVLVKAPDVPTPDEEIYDVSAGKYPTRIASFATLDAARRFVDLAPVPIEQSWVGGVMIDHVTAPTALEISVRKIYSAAQWLAHRAAIEGASLARQQNEKATAAREKDSAAEAKALNNLRANLCECRVKGQRYQRIADVFAQYVKTADGDEEMAARFLRKAFPASEIAEAAEWTGVDFGTPRDVPQYVAPVSAQEMSDAEPF